MIADVLSITQIGGLFKLGPRSRGFCLHVIEGTNSGSHYSLESLEKLLKKQSHCPCLPLQTLTSGGDGYLCPLKYRPRIQSALRSAALSPPQWALTDPRWWAWQRWHMLGWGGAVPRGLGLTFLTQPSPETVFLSGLEMMDLKEADTCRE